MDYTKFIPEVFRKNSTSGTLDQPTSKKAAVLSIVPKLETKKKNTIRITFKDNGFVSYNVFNCSDDPIEPWKDFYEWYENTTIDHYIMKYATGIKMFRRDDIKSFTCDITEEILESDE